MLQILMNAKKTLRFATWTQCVTIPRDHINAPAKTDIVGMDTIVQVNYSFCIIGQKIALIRARVNEKKSVHKLYPDYCFNFPAIFTTWFKAHLVIFSELWTILFFFYRYN